jgi:hypothetical protein
MPILNERQKDLLDLIRQDLKEATTSSSGSGRFTVPLSPGIRLFNKQQMQPFIIPTSHYDDAELAYDSYDGSLDVSKSEAKKMEDKARKVSKYIKNHPSDNDDDGDILNQAPGKMNESNTTYTAGEYTGPIELGLRKWKHHELYPFTEFSNHPVNEKKKKKTVKNNIKRTVGVWEKGSDGSYHIPTHDVHTAKSKTKMNESDDYDIHTLIKSIYPIIMKAAIIKVRSGDFVRKEDARRHIIDAIKNGDESIFEYLEGKTSGYNRDNFIDDINKLRKITKKNIDESKTDEIREIIMTITPIIMKVVNSEKNRITGLGDWMDEDKIKNKIIKKILSGDSDILDKLYEKSSGSYMKNEINRLRKILGKNINEDLAVWFGTKKKPKGSKQPKGPWVNICRKVDGKHPPCGRPEASDKGYPKCRAVGVASRMSDSQKKSACAQKRRVEKTHSKSGKGNKPKMASYKPRKEEKIDEIVNKVLNRINNVL